jgi:hypothetical protein
MLPPDWGYETIEVASASPLNKKKEGTGRFNAIVQTLCPLCCTTHSYAPQKKIAVSIIWMFELGLPPA